MPDEEAASLDKDPPKPAFVDAVYAVNAKGLYFTSKLAQHYFGLKGQEQPQLGSKALIMFSSLGAYFEFNNAEYVSSKYVSSFIRRYYFPSV